MSNDFVDFLWRHQVAAVRACPGCSPRFLPVARFGGARLTDGGSDEGGFDELARKISL